MSWSYSGDPSSSDKDAVRFNIGDTIEEDHQLQDEEILYLLDVNGGSVRNATIDAFKALISKYSRFVNEDVGDVSVDLSDRLANFKMALSEYERGLTALVSPYVGGISVSDKVNNERDTDRVGPFFDRPQFDNDRIGRGNNQTSDRFGC